MSTGNSQQEPIRVLVAAGGTGGHIFPAIAVVEQLLQRTNGMCSVTFMGSRDRMETQLIPALGYPYVSMPIEGFRGLSLHTLTLPFKIAASTSIARATIRTFKPHVVVVTGAYVSYPVGRAAAAEGVPLVVLESNLRPGKTNARLAASASAIIVAFPESIQHFPPQCASRIHVLGNPVRGAMQHLPSADEARRTLGLDPATPTVVILGGSLGARSLNRVVEMGLQELARAPYQVLWQTGKAYEPQSPLPTNVRSVRFIENMSAAYAAADLVVGRSGATTIAELALVGRPAIFVPLPTASTNEQEHNAQVAVNRGAALIVHDSEIETRLLALVSQVMDDEEERARMAAAMNTLAYPAASSDTASVVLSLARAQKGME